MTHVKGFLSYSREKCFFFLEHLELFKTTSRLGRVQFLSQSVFWSMMLLASMIPVYRLDAVGEESSIFATMSFWIFIITLLLCIPAVILIAKRRLHDINLSGWWVLLFIFLNTIPPLSFLGAIFLSFKSGTKGENRYGVPARKATRLDYIFIALYGLIAITTIGYLSVNV